MLYMSLDLTCLSCQRLGSVFWISTLNWDINELEVKCIYVFFFSPDYDHIMMLSCYPKTSILFGRIWCLILNDVQTRKNISSEKGSFYY